MYLRRSSKNFCRVAGWTESLMVVTLEDTMARSKRFEFGWAACLVLVLPASRRGKKPADRLDRVLLQSCKDAQGVVWPSQSWNADCDGRVRGAVHMVDRCGSCVHEKRPTKSRMTRGNININADVLSSQPSHHAAPCTMAEPALGNHTSHLTATQHAHRTTQEPPETKLLDDPNHHHHVTFNVSSRNDAVAKGLSFAGSLS